MIFVNISTISPPLSLYPAAQRVTFLYYLGRFSLSNNHHLRAALCLQEAYVQTPAQFVSHRTNILTYLIPCNLLLGRFPSQQLLASPEAQSLAPIFYPLCQAVKTGDFVRFQHHLATHEAWLFDKGLLLTLTHRLRPLVWRSLTRRAFLLTYVPPADPSSRKAATLDLADVLTLAVYLQRRLEGWLPPNPNLLRHAHSASSSLLVKAVSNNAYDAGTSTLAPPPGGTKQLRPNEGIVWGNAQVTPEDVEMTVATLVHQGFLHGFVAHGRAFAVSRGRAKLDPVVAGWPNVWQTIRDRNYEEAFDPDEVVGWVKG